MKKNHIFISLILTFVLLGLGVTGYLVSENKGRQGTVLLKPESEMIILNVFAGQSTTDAGIENIIDDWMALHYPHVKLEWESVDWGDQFDETLTARFISGDMPDIIIGKGQDIRNYVNKGIIAPFSFDITDDLSPEIAELALVDNQMYAIPYNTFYQGVIYNQTIFDSLGLEVPTNRQEIRQLVVVLQENKVTPFASHFKESWYVGNVTMQIMLNDVFRYDDRWGERFRKGEVSFTDDGRASTSIQENQFIWDNSWEDRLSIDQFECDQRFSEGGAAMYVTGTWSLQQMDLDDEYNHFGIFPYPSTYGEDALIREANMTFMKSYNTKEDALVDDILYQFFSDDDLMTDLLDFTQSFPVKTLESHVTQSSVYESIESYIKEDRIMEATIGNSQLVWTYQLGLAENILLWLQDKKEFDDILRLADQERQLSNH